MKKSDLFSLARDISRQLRKKKLELESKKSSASAQLAIPDIFFEKNSDGTYPVVALRSYPCDKYLQGYCLPCGYSARCYPKTTSRERYNSLLDQLQWLLENFNSVFRERASGNLSGYHLKHAVQGESYMMELAGESSFFSDREIPPKYRKTILSKLFEFQHQNDVAFHVIIETRPEHFVQAEKNGELADLTELFTHLNVAVNFGFEYRDNFLRNNLYGKDLVLNDFIAAVKIAHKYQLDPGAFLFCGGCILSAEEMLSELHAGLEFFYEHNVFANVMLQNIQSFTLPDLLWEYDYFTLPEPFILLDIIDLLLDFTPERPGKITPFDWFIGGLTSDPNPKITLLNNPLKKTSDRVTANIAECFDDLVKYSDVMAYRDKVKTLQKTPEYKDYLSFKEEGDNRPYPERCKEMLLFAKSKLNEYIKIYSELHK